MAAEVLRRSAEMVFETELPEEDQLGFGFGMERVKKNRYGTQRLLESFDAKTRFIRDLGLDYTVRLRWLVGLSVPVDAPGDRGREALRLPAPGELTLDVATAKP